MKRWQDNNITRWPDDKVVWWHDNSCQILANCGKNCQQKLPEVAKSCPKLPKVAKACQKLPKVSHMIVFVFVFACVFVIVNRSPKNVYIFSSAGWKNNINSISLLTRCESLVWFQEILLSGCEDKCLLLELPVSITDQLFCTTVSGHFKGISPTIFILTLTSTFRDVGTLWHL